MQAVNQEQVITQIQEPVAFNVSVEIIAYTVLIIFALLLRLGNLGSVPMSDVEAIQALSAYEVANPETPAQAQPAHSPIIFWLQNLAFSTFAKDEIAARLPGVIGSMVLIFMPLLFREKIGREQTFALSLLLAFSPIAFVASRMADPTIWTMVFAFATLWAFWRYWDSRSQSDAIIAAGCLGALAFLAESGGLLFAIILAIAAYVTVWWTVLESPEERDTPGDEVWLSAKFFVAGMPIVQMLIAIAGIVFLGSTLFFTYPAGLNSVAEVIRGTLTGFFQLYQPDTPALISIWTLVVYNLWLVLLAIIAGVVLVVNRGATFVDRFAIVTTIMAFVVLLFYRGAKPSYALFMAVPSMWLVARLIRELTINYTPIIFSYDGFQLIDEEDDSYWWIKWVLSAIIVTLLVMLVFHWQEIGRGILQFPSEGIFSALGQAQFTTFRASLVWFIVTIMFLAVGYFLSASVCGHINTLQGFGLGLVLLMLGSGIGTGWNVAVVNATNPYELWNNTNITEDAYDLRTTLLEIADRDTRGFPLIDLKIVRDESAGITDNGIVAWLVRDFQNAEFVDSLEDAKREEIVLMSIIDEEPDLDGSYVGQSFLIREKWTIRNLRFGEWISWFSQRRVRATETLQDRIILWLRIDVYDDIPAQERIRG